MTDPLFSILFTISILVLLSVIFWPERGVYSRWQQSQKFKRRVLLEDALKHLFTCMLEKRHPTVESIAGALTINANDATEVITQLEMRGLLVVSKGELQLTKPGREYALRIIRAHRIWESYLSEKTGYDEIDWHAMAEKQEHHLTPEETNELANQIGNPSHDPHGDPIPTTDGAYAMPASIPLSNLPVDQPAQIVHIEDEPVVIYSQIVAAGLHMGMSVTVLETSNERVRFWANGDEQVLAPLLAKNISVRPSLQTMPAVEPGFPLSDLSQGETARVTAISPVIRGAERRRLMDLGLLPGTEVTAELVSPAGDPTAYLVRGALIALRANQASHIRVTNQGAKHDGN